MKKKQSNLTHFVETTDLGASVFAGVGLISGPENVTEKNNNLKVKNDCYKTLFLGFEMIALELSKNTHCNFN